MWEGLLFNSELPNVQPVHQWRDELAWQHVVCTVELHLEANCQQRLRIFGTLKVNFNSLGDKLLKHPVILDLSAIFQMLKNKARQVPMQNLNQVVLVAFQTSHLDKEFKTLDA